MQKNGQYLVFSSKNQQPLKEEDLSALQVRMIESNHIPRILPIKIEEIDFKVKIQYNITSKRMLRLYTKEQPLSMNEYFSLFINMIRTIEESNVYMLNEENYILKEEFIFIGKDVHDVYLTYLPLQTVNREHDSLAEMKDLLLNVAGEVHGLHGDVYKQLISYSKSSRFSLQGLKEMLSELQGFYGVPAYNVMNSAAPYGGQPLNPSYQPNVQVPAQPPHQPETSSKTSAKKSVKHVVRKEKPKPLNQREMVYLFSAAALFIAIVWKVYEIAPYSTMLIVSSSLSVLIAGASFGYWIYRKVVPKKVKLKAAVQEETEQPALEETAAAAFPYGYTQPQPVTGSPNIPIPKNDYAYTGNPFHNPSTPDYKQFQEKMSEKLQAKPGNDETILLGEEGEDEPNVPAQKLKIFYLEVNRNGQKEEIMIDQDHFIIGRNEASVHYVEDILGVSRVHLEFVKIDGNFGVKDLGSRNGTKLNGKQIVPYKIYALNEKDQITIGNVTYTFKWRLQ